MKFMQRREESVMREKLENERQKIIQDAHWVIGTGNYASTIQAVQISRTANVATGRRSFGSFNPLVEKLVKGLIDAPLLNNENDETVTDEQMADLSSDYQGLRHGKQAQKSKGNPSKDPQPTRTAQSTSCNMARTFLDKIAGELDLESNGKRKRPEDSPSQAASPSVVKQFKKPVLLPC